MRAISLWQPWATLVAWGEKKYETRHWSTDYRGPLAIHAAKRKPNANEIVDITEWESAVWMHTQMDAAQYFKQCLPLGAVLCVVNLVDCRPTEQVRESIKYKEWAFGNYRDGRFAWKLELVEVFSQPIPAVGHQGFFNWKRPAV